MAEVIDFEKKSGEIQANNELQLFVRELIERLYEEIHTFTNAKTDEEKEKIGMAHLEFLRNGLQKIKDQYHLTDDELGEIMKKLDHKSLVFDICSKLDK